MPDREGGYPKELAFLRGTGISFIDVSRYRRVRDELAYAETGGKAAFLMAL